MPKKSIVKAVLAKVTAAGSGVVSIFSGLLAALLVVYSGYVLYDNIYTRTQAESGWDLLQYRPEIIDDGGVPLSASALSSLNEDYRAWITLYDTHIDYPVMQGSNDLYYASHDVYKKSSLTGAIYLAAGNSADFSDSYNLIYGHHMDGDAMFGPLDHYTEKGYPESHREGILVTQDEVFDLYVFAVMLTDAYASELYSPGGDRMGDVLTFLQDGLDSDTVYFDEKAAAEAVRIVALSTCESAETNGRLVVFARMDQRQTEKYPPDELNQSGTGNPGEDPDSGNTPSGSDTPGGGNTPSGSDAPGGVNTPSESGGSQGTNGVDPGTGTVTAGTPADTSSGTGVPVQTNSGADGGQDLIGSSGGMDLITEAELEEAGETDAPEMEEIDDDQTPLARLFNRFHPTGSSFGRRAWALLNLICLIITIYLLIPVLHLKAKYNRKKQMRKVNELEAACEELEDSKAAAAAAETKAAAEAEGTALETEAAEKAESAEEKGKASDEEAYFRIEKFVKRFRIGLILEIVICILAVIAFILTEDIRLPMILIDRWTPLMILFLLLCWITDVRLVRYRSGEGKEES